MVAFRGGARRDGSLWPSEAALVAMDQEQETTTTIHVVLRDSSSIILHYFAIVL
jgi:hypothetical protein